MILSIFSSYGANISQNSDASHGDLPNVSGPGSVFVIVASKTASSRIVFMSASIALKHVRRMSSTVRQQRATLLLRTWTSFCCNNGDSAFSAKGSGDVELCGVGIWNGSGGSSE